MKVYDSIYFYTRYMSIMIMTFDGAQALSANTSIILYIAREFQGDFNYHSAHIIHKASTWDI